MFDKWRKYSYAAQKSQRHRVRWILLWIAAFFVVYTILTSLVFSIWVLENETMQPGLRTGDRFIFSSYKIYSILSLTDIEMPFHRGNIVLVDMGQNEKSGFFSTILDGVVRFFSAQRLGVDKSGKDVFIKRVIGLPGDEITMTNFVIRVKPRGDSYSFTEFELWDRPYEVTIPQVPALWDESLPFSGSMEKIVLDDGECFVLSDDRSNTNDSRTWGPVPVKSVAGKALFRYWPFTRLGLP
jgi:signal peptidase I